MRACACRRRCSGNRFAPTTGGGPLPNPLPSEKGVPRGLSRKGSACEIRAYPRPQAPTYHAASGIPSDGRSEWMTGEGRTERVIDGRQIALLMHRHNNFVVIDGVMDRALILNEREAGKARTTVQRVREALAPVSTLEATRTGLAIEILESHRKAIATLGAQLTKALDAYDAAKQGEVQDQISAWRGEPGIVLILARIAKGMSQGDLARAIGMREQQIQRYEADRYKSISLANYRRFSDILNVRLEASMSETSNWLPRSRSIIEEYPKEEFRKLLKHAIERGWIESKGDVAENSKELADFLSVGSGGHVSAALLRTGTKSEPVASELSLAAWRAAVIRRAEAMLEGMPTFDLLDISWLGEFVRLSSKPTGPKEALDFLRAKGIVTVIEPQMSGLGVDGAALILSGIPVIGLTLRFDRIDYFWFTLLHEVAHIFLHHSSGLSEGFFDDVEESSDDRAEIEANEFASSALIPSERWRMSPARISSDPEPIEQLARQLGIHSAIAFGRVRKERRNYSLFSNKVGHGLVRKLLIP